VRAAFPVLHVGWSAAPRQPRACVVWSRPHTPTSSVSPCARTLGPCTERAQCPVPIKPMRSLPIVQPAYPWRADHDCGDPDAVHTTIPARWSACPTRLRYAWLERCVRARPVASHIRPRITRRVHLEPDRAAAPARVVPTRLQPVCEWQPQASGHQFDHQTVKMEGVPLLEPDLPPNRRKLPSCPRGVGSMQSTASWRIRSGRTWLDRNLSHRCPITVVSARRGNLGHRGALCGNRVHRGTRERIFA